MTDQPNPKTEALENLRVIRSLMERAHVYRSISAPAAIFGGSLALLVSAFGFYSNFIHISSSFREREFLFSWLFLLFLTSALNAYLLAKDAQKRAKPFINEGLRMALRAIIPPLLTGGVLGVGLIWFERQLQLAALIWILCYGLALQATVGFAPKSLIRLARAFLITGQALTIWWFLSGGFGEFQRSEAPASLFLGLTFGLFHLIYGVSILASSREPKATRTNHD